MHAQAGAPEAVERPQVLDTRLIEMINHAVSRDHPLGDGNDGFEADEQYEYRNGFRDALESMALALQCAGVALEIISACVHTALEAEANNH